ncbi:choice-of-anchor J domain-containing protein, partial [Crocinitomix catalasitica]|nr:choice-of-anchor J domain-containing protein [Crocinitomix catalasitica]
TPASSGYAPYAGWGFYENQDEKDWCAASASAYTPAGTSDDWLITPAITIPATGDMLLIFDVKSRFPGMLMDYEVRMSIGSGSTAAVDFTYVLETVVGHPTNWIKKSLALPSAALGNDIHIAFREMTFDSNLLLVDNVSVLSLYPDDIRMEWMTNETFVEAGTQQLTGVVRNSGANSITSFDLTWDDGSGPNTQTITTTIPSWSLYFFTHPTNLNAIGGTYYDINITATVTGDGDPSNDDMPTWMSAVTSKPIKIVVGEERTGSWCGWCPRGAVGMETMDAYPTWIGIAVHEGDPMEHTIYNQEIEWYIPYGFPTSGVDRVWGSVDPDDFAWFHDDRVDMVSPAAITTDAVLTGSNIDVTVSAEFFGPINGDYRLACVITEDNITGTTSGYDQTNYYSFEASNIPLVGAGHDWQAEPNPVPAADMEYDHVAVRLGDDEINGAAGSLSPIVNAGTTESYTYSFDATGLNLDNCHFIGMLIDNSTGEILNAGTSVLTVGIQEQQGFDVSVYPNPAENLTNVELILEVSADVSIVMYNSMGQVVYTKTKRTLAAGTQHLAIDVASLAKGIYALRIEIGNEVETIKLLKN